MMNNENMVNITINGKAASVAAGTTILEACRSIGIEIPTLCYLAGEMPDGSCRMCVVEVEGGYLLCLCQKRLLYPARVLSGIWCG